MTNSGFLFFLARVFSNKNKDLFIVRLGVSLLVGRFGVSSFLATPLESFLRGVIGVFMEEGIFLIDLSIDALKEGRKLKNFELLATQAYIKASEKVYSEEEKQKIRQEYLDIIGNFIVVE